MSTNAILTALTTAVSLATASLTPRPIVRGFRANPISRTEPEIMISLLSSQPSIVSPSQYLIEWHDFVLLAHTPYLKANTTQMETAERALNEIQDAILHAAPAWRSSTDPLLYPWQKAVPVRPSNRPPSPNDLAQYRLGQIYLRLYL
jgi:hypothetical protein